MGQNIPFTAHLPATLRGRSPGEVWSSSGGECGAVPEWTPGWQGLQGQSHLALCSQRSGSAGCSTHGNRAARPSSEGTPWWLTCPRQSTPYRHILTVHTNCYQHKTFHISKRNISRNKVIHPLYPPPQIFKSSLFPRNCKRFYNISYECYKFSRWLLEHMRGKCKYQEN